MRQIPVISHSAGIYRSLLRETCRHRVSRIPVKLTVQPFHGGAHLDRQAEIYCGLWFRTGPRPLLLVFTFTGKLVALWWGEMTFEFQLLSPRGVCIRVPCLSRNLTSIAGDPAYYWWFKMQNGEGTEEGSSSALSSSVKDFSSPPW